MDQPANLERYMLDVGMAPSLKAANSYGDGLF